MNILISSKPKAAIYKKHWLDLQNLIWKAIPLPNFCSGNSDPCQPLYFQRCI